MYPKFFFTNVLSLESMPIIGIFFYSTIVEAIVNVGLLFAWSCVCLMNTLDGCDLLEKVFNISDVHEHKDVTVAIKVYLYNNSDLLMQSMLIIIVLNMK